jgi:tRNA-dihydrouridine synthase
MEGWQDYTQGPVVVQLAGHDAKEVVSAAQWLVEHTQGRLTGIDLNCGCPQQIARKGKYGAFFTEADNGKSAAQVLKAVRQAVPDHVTVSTKCRLPLQSDLLRERAHRLQDAGIDFLTIHGRTLRENKTLTGPCNIQAIRQVVEWLDIPVIANGGIESPDDVQSVLQQTQAAAVMSSEALLERPDLFLPSASNDETLSAKQILDRQFQFARDYLAWTRLFPPLPGVLGQHGGSFNIVRSHLFKFLHRYWQEQADLRDELASHQRMLGLQDAYNLVDRLQDRYNGVEDWTNLFSSSMTSSWYRRHWQANGVTSITCRARHVEKVPPPMTVEERKAQLQKRIALLRAQRQHRQTVANNMLP